MNKSNFWILKLKCKKIVERRTNIAHKLVRSSSRRSKNKREWMLWSIADAQVEELLTKLWK